MKRIGIIGAGRFGMSLAESLANAGAEVLLLDRNRPAMQLASEYANAVQGDATQRHVLEEAGFGECDVVVVAIGSNIEASMMATANCKEIGIQDIVAKASSELHGKILRKIGADSVVYPDRDSANRLAKAIANHDVVDFLEVAPYADLLCRRAKEIECYCAIVMDDGRLYPRTLSQLLLCQAAQSYEQATS